MACRQVEFGISSFIFRAKRPFHPERLQAALGSRPRPGALAGLLRLKGFAWLATQPRQQAHAALAGTRRAAVFLAFFFGLGGLGAADPRPVPSALSMEESMLGSGSAGVEKRAARGLQHGRRLLLDLLQVAPRARELRVAVDGGLELLRALEQVLEHRGHLRSPIAASASPSARAVF